ncbi:DUF1631 domain-containing protein [Sedimenticola hydrogenitrophicus]|uniref:DUF1631 domain-containing protein n=1 Tax=Sedimenticola hydrogenitrophicus TaxID=2967975 RepID=UPI0021A7178C|nr:DUF1631 domain-containing protein [Sedimenticola hydrogenitrophicus]
MEELSEKPQPAQSEIKHQQLLGECRDMVMVYLTTQLNELFQQIEPVFLDFAKKAETNASQARFFEAINHILSLRDAIEHDFRESIEQGFKLFIQGKPIVYPNSPAEEATEIELEVVDNEALEKHIAIQSMISKAQSDCYQELYSLGKRLAVLRGGKKLAEDDIPACPAHTAIAFQQAAEVLDTDKQIQLIVYFLFGKYVLGDAKSIYNNLNDKLIEAGIFPNLKLSSIIPPPSRQAPADAAARHPMEPTRVGPFDAGPAHATTGQAAPAGGSAVLGEELFQSIHDLLTARRAADPDYSNHPDQVPGGNTAQLKSASAIAQAIEQVQPHSQADYLPVPESDGGIPQSIELDTNLIQNVRRTLESERTKLLNELDRSTIPSADLDTIELVGMLFEQVLDEEGLANIAKALISHLHTPYLKIAILDHTFLTDEAHTARKLLNLMVDAGKRWIDEEDLRRGIYYPMQGLVKTILTEFKNELSIFDEMLYKLERQTDELESRAKILEERNQEAAKGRERLETARKRAREEIERRTRGRHLHPVLERFLNHAWLDRMILMLLRDAEAESSKEWTSVLAVIDSLVQVIDARHNPRAREWLIKNQKNLVQHIKTGLDSLGNYHHPDSNALFKLLASIVSEQPAAPEVKQKPEGEVEISQPIIKPISNEKKPMPAHPATPLPNDEEEQMLVKLREVRFGTWFELVDEHDKLRRLKLSWFSPITHKYMFVDRFGIQAYITPSEELAKQLCSGKARMIEPTGIPFVSKALKAIHSILQKSIGIHPAG